ncbi:hypothetical protein ACSV5M_15560 [Cellvibrio sp. ARAG 10.3]|uniref:hypothetical protein n=1 Tax=Cellvibrio sp. ARAG 10.3 TaxID=3451358 RepID=UPI003F48A223
MAILFSPCNGASRKAAGRSGLELPDGQLLRILRYIFESYFVINGGNILALQRILGHSDLRVTMCGAHLVPETWQGLEGFASLTVLFIAKKWVTL